MTVANAHAVSATGAAGRAPVVSLPLPLIGLLTLLLTIGSLLLPGLSTVLTG